MLAPVADDLDLPLAPAVVGSPGGTVVAFCTGGVVEIVSASPAQGYGLDEPEHERVRFESDEAKVEVRLSCRDGRPVGDVRVDDD